MKPAEPNTRASEQQSSHELEGVVEEGYSMMASRYTEWSKRTRTLQMEYLNRLLGRFPARSNVLEVGCGAGLPATRILARRHEVTATDVSRAQISLANENAPNAKLVHGDMVSALATVQKIWHFSNILVNSFSFNKPLLYKLSR